MGFGRHEFPTGEVYTGFYHNHLKHGEGTQIFRDGSKYVGHWVMDMPHGHGLRTYADGSHFEGQWRCGVRHGIGSYHHISGCKYEGLWTNDKPNWQPTKLRLILASEYIQFNFNTEFSLIVECLDENQKVCDLDEGREIQILVGITKEDILKESVCIESKNDNCDENEVKSDCIDVSKKNTYISKNIVNISTIEDSLTEPQLFALINMGIKMEEMYLLKGTLTIEFGEENKLLESSEQKSEVKLDQEDPLKSESGIASEIITEEDEKKSDAMEETEEEEIKMTNEEQPSLLPQSCPSTEKKMPEKNFFTEFNGVVRASQGKVLVDQLMISRRKEVRKSNSVEIVDEQKPVKLVIIARDVTCPPFMDIHLKPDFIMKEL